MMKPQQLFSRRRFLWTTAATAGGAWMAGAVGRGADSAARASTVASTDHFWYRAQPEELFVDSQRGNKAFAYADGKIFLSEDNGHTWSHSSEFPDARQIVFSCILGNGNVLFSAMGKLYLSADNLKTYRPVTVKNADGSDYLAHTPRNPDNPGWYFHSLTGVNTWDVEGREMLVWGNYCNVVGGASPVNIYYSCDGGETVKIAYSFGQNPYFRDNGSGGGGREGALLGNPGNPVICRHVHDVAYNPAENAFYACTGDADRPEGYECHWLRGTYDAGKDAWQWKVIVSDATNSRYKCGGINFVDGQVYWISDSNGPKPYDRELRRDPADITDPKAHTSAVQPRRRVRQHDHPGRRDPGIALRSRVADGHGVLIIVSLDLGKISAVRSGESSAGRPCRFHRKNGEGGLM